jgi:hypothetical protein
VPIYHRPVLPEVAMCQDHYGEQLSYPVYLPCCCFNIVRLIEDILQGRRGAVKAAILARPEKIVAEWITGRLQPSEKADHGNAGPQKRLIASYLFLLLRAFVPALCLCVDLLIFYFLPFLCAFAPTSCLRVDPLSFIFAFVSPPFSSCILVLLDSSCDLLSFVFIFPPFFFVQLSALSPFV